MKNDELYKAAKKAIDNLFADTSVSAGQTKERLEDLADEIEMKIESLREP